MSWLDSFADESSIKNQTDSLGSESSPPQPSLMQGSLNAIFQGFDVGGIRMAATLHRPRRPLNGGEFPDQAQHDIDMQAHDENVARTIKLFTPDPETTGKGAQMLFNLMDVIPRTVAGGAIAGPAGAAVMAGGPQYESGKDEAIYNEHLDEITATKKAAIDAGVLGVGAVLPGGHIFKNFAADLVGTVSANVGLGMFARGANSKILADAGYLEQASQYKATDKTQVLADGVLSLAFFGGARLTKTAPQLVDAALVENQNNHLTTESAPGVPVDAKSSNIHQKTMQESLDQLINDKPVSVNTNIHEATFIKPDINAPIVSKGAMVHFDTVQSVAKNTGVNPNILLAQIDVESGGNVNARSSAGAEGVSQFMPFTALQYGVNVKDAASSIDGQGRYMASLLKMFNGDYRKALAGYNAGEGNVQKAVRKFGDNWLANLDKITSPKNATKTRNYVTKIMAKARTGTVAGDNLAIRSVDEPAQLRQQYNALKDSDGGRVLNTDLARELSPEYAADRSKSADVHEESSQFIKDLYAEKLAAPTPAEKLPIVFFTAGGTGAGKTTSLNIDAIKNTHTNAEIIYDTNMNKLGSAVNKIEQALDANRYVYIQYTYRDPVESLVMGALHRAMRMGRTVPLDAHADTHIGASSTIRELQQKYQNDERVKFVSVDNSLGKGNQQLSALDNLPQVTDNGLTERLNDALETEYQAGRISEKVYDATKGQYKSPVDTSRVQGDSRTDGAGINRQYDAQPQQSEVDSLIQPIKIDGGLTGSSSKAFTERGNSIDTNYAVIDAADLVTSHDNALNLNPNYPHKLQPRDRTRDASEAQISRIENSINPELLAESPKVSDGSPIIGSDGVVESGNARTIALRRAYETGKAEHYREWLKKNADRFGIDAEKLAGVKNPVLVRLRNSNVDRAEFARQANESAVTALSLTELAKSDAARLSSLDGMMANQDGSINFNASNTFVRRFMQEAVSPTEQNAMMSGDGRLSQQGEMRIRNAVFSKAYGDSNIVGMMLESTDANIKNILNGMLRAAPAVARLREMISEGGRYPIDISPDLVKAVREYSDMRKNGYSLEQYLAQQDMFDLSITPEMQKLITGLQENARSPKGIADFINSFVRAVDNLGDPRQADMLNAAPPKQQELVNNAVETMRTQQSGDSSADLFNTPELKSAKEVAELNPNLKVILEDGREVTATDAINMIDADLKNAENDSKSFAAAINCFLRT